MVSPKSHEFTTVVELLSPAHKRAGPDRDAYLAKRDLSSSVNLVEIDLLRGGQRILDNALLPLKGDYYAFVSRAAHRQTVDVYSFTIHDPLPVLPVPLVAGERDIPLHLRRCLDRAMKEGRYAEEINYREPPDPPLPPADAE